MKDSMRELVAYVEEEVDKAGYDLTQLLPSKFITEVTSAKGVPRVKAREALATVRRRRRVSVQRKPKVKRSKHNAILEACKKSGFWRQANAEGPACETMEKFILNKLPKGGHGLIIGTALPFFASNHPKGKETIYDDEYAVSQILRMTCDSMTIVIGNGVSRKKAQKKADTLDRLYTMRKARIIVDAVNRDSYSRWITKLIEQYSICKVLLITSGSWEGSAYSYKKFGFDVNFQAPSKYLTSRYSNLHILALRMVGTYKFDVLYVHNGVERVIE